MKIVLQELTKKYPPRGRKGKEVVALDCFTFEIPDGTQPGTKFTVRQKGIPYINNQNKRGDLIFTVNVEIPKSLNKEQRERMEAFAKSCKESNYTKKQSFFKRIRDKK